MNLGEFLSEIKVETSEELDGQAVIPSWPAFYHEFLASPEARSLLAPKPRSNLTSIPKIDRQTFASFYRRYLSEDCGPLIHRDAVLELALHFAALQRDIPSASVGRTGILLHVGRDASVFFRTVPALALLESIFVPIANFPLRAGRSQIPGLSKAFYWMSPLDEIVQSLRERFEIWVAVLTDIGSTEKWRETLEVLAPICGTNTILVARDSRQLMEAACVGLPGSPPPTMLPAASLDQAVVAAESIFGANAPISSKLEVMPGLRATWLPSRQPRLSHAILRSRDLPSQPLSRQIFDPQAVSENVCVLTRTESVFVASSQPVVLDNVPAGSWVESLINPRIPLRPQTLAIYPKALAAGSGIILTKEGHVAEESFLPVVDAGEPTTWGRKYPLGQGDENGYLGFLDQRFLAPAEAPGRFNVAQIPKPSRHLSGPVLFIAGLYHHVYSHWIIDILSKLWVLPELESGGLSDYKLAVSGPITVKQAEMIRLAGVPSDRVFPIRSNEWFTSDLLVVPSRPARMYDFVRQEVFEFYDRLSGKALKEADTASSLPRRVYAGRQGSLGRRRLLNEDRVLGIFEDAGCQTVEFSRLTVAEEITLFRRAELVAAPHGSALTGMIYMGPGSKVCCLLPRDLLRVIRHHFSLSAPRGISLTAVIGESFHSRIDVANWIVDESLVRESIERMVIC